MRFPRQLEKNEQTAAMDPDARLGSQELWRIRIVVHNGPPEMTCTVRQSIL